MSHRAHADLLATLIARTKEEAATFPALEAPFVGVRMTRRGLRAQAARGHLDLVAGRTDAAVQRLEEATHNCGVLLEPFLWVRSHLWLGQAYEQSGDTPSACKAYAVVMKRWGVEEPLGRTAAEAKKRMAKLDCK